MFDPDFLDFIECLNRTEAAYVLIGGYAVVIKGYPRTTGDLNFFVARTPENAAKVIKAIEEFGFKSLGFTTDDVMDKQGYIQMGVEPVTK